MLKFCSNCGTPLDKNGKCPKCDGAQPVKTMGKPKKTVHPQDAKFIPRKNGKRSKFAIWSIIVLSVLVATTITLSVLVYFDKLNIPYINDVFVYMNIKKESQAVQPVPEQTGEQQTEQPQQEETESVDDPNKYKVTPPDADKYFSQNATVQSEMQLGQSQTVSSESDVYSNLRDRGFGYYPVITNYSTSGAYLGDVEISSYSSTKHPMYQTYYVTPSGDMWVIIEVNGTIMANPASYNNRSGKSAPVIISETNTITSYDSTLNKFYVSVPNSNIAKVKKVDYINAELLDMLTDGEIDAL